MNETIDAIRRHEPECRTEGIALDAARAERVTQALTCVGMLSAMQTTPEGFPAGWRDQLASLRQGKPTDEPLARRALKLIHSCWADSSTRDLFGFVTGDTLRGSANGQWFLVHAARANLRLAPDCGRFAVIEGGCVEASGRAPAKELFEELTLERLRLHALLAASVSEPGMLDEHLLLGLVQELWGIRQGDVLRTPSGQRLVLARVIPQYTNLPRLVFEGENLGEGPETVGVWTTLWRPSVWPVIQRTLPRRAHTIHRR